MSESFFVNLNEATLKKVEKRIENLAKKGGIANVKDFINEVNELILLYKETDYIEHQSKALQDQPSASRKMLKNIDKKLQSLRLSLKALDGVVLDSINQAMLSHYIKSLESIDESRHKKRVLIELYQRLDVVSLVEGLSGSVLLATESSKGLKRNASIYELVSELSRLWLGYGGKATKGTGTSYQFLAMCVNLVDRFADPTGSDKSETFYNIMISIKNEPYGTD